ncbi:sialate O-acetylesterase [Sinomicrobium weinanense]|uniref:Beta galactosidase jelly roll domain-containing protein n=1 Tax=Sinomicrobium weinanense TaxID=2842200 RepID=A0A926JV83_9FLAO|nr:sialate O-acetylesterase [Sinomicrobium weinanense]MBC9797939.1 beta galactosidase jelly roll domain-containing protein [Sinomicrobium weinanense]MBU3123269.1 beta galactosidase jelly roll domain-containing protein [Sinomicrobium weinanense]
MMKLILTLQFILGIFFTGHAQELRLPAYFTDHMVLQRDVPTVLWGWSAPGQSVKVEISRHRISTKTGRNGKWEIRLPAFPAGGPYTIKISAGPEVKTLSNILMGDVWICSGQSNMEWPVRQTPYKETDTVWLKKRQLRFLKVNPETDYRPREDVNSRGWITPGLEDIAHFSAVGYHFGKFIQRQSDVPIGLISVNLGATAIETWMSNEALGKFPQFRKEIDHTGSFAEVKKAFEKSKDKWYEQYYYTGKGIEEQWFLPETDTATWDSIKVAGNTWESEKDLRDFDGAVWFRTSFDLPEGFKGDSLHLQLLQIDDYDITWVNGHRIGETFGRHNHRNYQVPSEILKEKDNILVVRVFDTGGPGGFTTSAFWGNDILRGNWYYKKGLEIDPEKFPEQELVNVSPFSSPGVLYNANVAPLTALRVKGVIWYQGESNAERAAEYRDLFPALIRDWRDKFGQDMPFLWVQLANYGEEPGQPGPSPWAELREAQDLALKLPKTGMAVTIDIGEAGDIHPKNKEEVGRRLGALAGNLCYRGKQPAPGPRFKAMEKSGDSLLVRFHFATDALKTSDKHGYIRGFQIAGKNGPFRWAKAFLRGNTVVVYHPDLKDPAALRYAWSDNPGPLDLTDQNGLPAEPFRSDNRELSTKGKVFTGKASRF